MKRVQKAPEGETCWVYEDAPGASCESPAAVNIDEGGALGTLYCHRHAVEILKGLAWELDYEIKKREKPWRVKHYSPEHTSPE